MDDSEKRKAGKRKVRGCGERCVPAGDRRHWSPSRRYGPWTRVGSRGPAGSWRVRDCSFDNHCEQGIGCHRNGRTVVDQDAGCGRCPCLIVETIRRGQTAALSPADTRWEPRCRGARDDCSSRLSKRDSNPLPRECHSRALPIELFDSCRTPLEPGVAEHAQRTAGTTLRAPPDDVRRSIGRIGSWKGDSFVG